MESVANVIVTGRRAIRAEAVVEECRRSSGEPRGSYDAPLGIFWRCQTLVYGKPVEDGR
jgi:hypothetical protein